MAIAREERGRADDGPVCIAMVVEDGSSAATPPHELDALKTGAERLAIAEERKVYFRPRVLVATDDDTWVVDVLKENDGGRGGGLEEVMLNGEVQEWIV